MSENDNLFLFNFKENAFWIFPLFTKEINATSNPARNTLINQTFCM